MLEQQPGVRAGIGMAAVAALALLRAPSPYHDGWAQVAVAWAALVLVPLVLELFDEPKETPSAARWRGWAVRGQLPAGVALVVACGLERGPMALVLALPWLAVTGLLAAAGVARMRAGGLKRDLHRLAADAALVFAGVGGLWVLVDRGGFQPLDFPPQIVALTAVHFHYAGLLLPLVAGLTQEQMWMSRLASRALVGTVLGVPAVALGIVTTQLGWGRAVEAGAGGGLALAGMAVGVLHVRLAWEGKWSAATRGLLGVAGVALFFAMVLAALYSGRGYVSAAAGLGIPQMQALHGTLNALGFGLAGVLAWRAVRRSGRAGPAL